MSQVHPRARTTPLTRAEIRASSAPVTALAERYDITVSAAGKWKLREDLRRSACNCDPRAGRPLECPGLQPTMREDLLYHGPF